MKDSLTEWHNLDMKIMKILNDEFFHWAVIYCYGYISSAYTVESDLIRTKMLAFPSKSSNKNDSDSIDEKTNPI